jgi:hypothetical protein
VVVVQIAVAADDPTHLRNSRSHCLVRRSRLEDPKDDLEEMRGMIEEGVVGRNDVESTMLRIDRLFWM